jgi:formate dehydrogenase beta subunit
VTVAPDSGADSSAGRPETHLHPWVPGVEARAGRFPGPSLIPELTAIQSRLGWLPRDELVALARRMRRPLYEIEGLVSFCPHLRTEAPPAVTVHACRDLPCCLAGAREGTLSAARPTTPARDTPWPNDPYAPGEPRYQVLRGLLRGSVTPGEVISTLVESGLRGMGRAGFPTGRKWELVAAQPGAVKYAICNADESEPGTFKDRQILADQPYLVLEGLLVGMLCVGAEQGWVFIRHEYGPEELLLRAEIEALHAEGLLGVDVQGSGRTLRLEVVTSPGGYILGEESALIECMEGHRGELRNKPPFPGVYGLHGRPTLMNSVETFANVPVIVQRGARWWVDAGLGESVGWRWPAASSTTPVQRSSPGWTP